MGNTYPANEAGYGVTIEAIGGFVQVTARTPFGNKQIHYPIHIARLMADAIGFAANDAEDQQARRRLGMPPA